MTNTLTKQFITEYTLIPGYTIRRWHPAVTTTSTQYIGVSTLTTSTMLVPPWANGIGLGGNVFIISVKRDANGTTYTVGEYVTVTQAITTTTTTPGYYSYDVQPDTYTLSYNPNLSWNASARSLAVIDADGEATFSIPLSSVGVVMGFNEPGDSLGSGYVDINYGLYCTRGIYRVLEDGVVKFGGLAYNEGDVFSITRTAGSVVYALNAVPFYTSLTASTGPLLLDTSLYAGGDSVYNAGLIAQGTLANAVGTLDGSFAPMTALLTGGFPEYTEINASFAPMTASLRQTELSNSYSAIAGAFLPMTANLHELTGTTTLDTVMTFAPMVAFLADHAYAEINAVMPPMQAFAGQFPDLGNIGFIGKPVFGLNGSGHSLAADSGLITAPVFGAQGNGGGNGLITAPAFGLTANGTLIASGYGLITKPTFSLTASGLAEGNGQALIGRPQFGLQGNGGGSGRITRFNSTIVGGGLWMGSGNGLVTAPQFGLTGQGTRDNSGSGLITKPHFGMKVWNFGVITAPVFGLTANGLIAAANSVSYVMNVVTQESTRWTNQNFQHIICIGQKNYGVTETGLFEINETIDTDNGVAINGTILGKTTDFGVFQSKNVPAVYLDSDTDTTITAFVDDVQKGTYPSSFKGRKCQLGLGNQGRYYQLKIEHVVALNGLEVLVNEKQRRVK
jgi:hypothetical protein